MKAYLKFISMVALISICLYSCKKDDNPPPITEPLDDNSLPSAAILRIHVVEKTNDLLKFQVDLAVFRDSENIEENLESSNFRMDSLKIYSTGFGFQNDITRLVSGGSNTNYSALMLMDQSGSISTTDPDDHRLEAARIFAKNMGAGNEAALWSFAGSSYNPLVDFTTDTTKVIGEIENLRGQQGGSTPLYKAQYDAVTHANEASTKLSKALLTFTDGENTEYGKTSNDVVAHAKNSNVALYNIGLGDANTTLLLQQSIATEGGFMYAKDARQLISIFGNLGKLLSNTATFYQTQWTISSADASNPFQGSGEFVHEMTITFPFGGEIKVPFRVSF